MKNFSRSVAISYLQTINPYNNTPIVLYLAY